MSALDFRISLLRSVFILTYKQTLGTTVSSALKLLRHPLFQHPLSPLENRV